MAKGGESAVVRIFDREVAWELPSRSSAHADVVAALEPATEKLEAWRYSPIDDVSVASYAAVATETIDLGAARALLGAAGRSGGADVVVGPRGLVAAHEVEGSAVAGDRGADELITLDEEPFATLANLLAPERVELRLDGAAEAALIVGGSGHQSAAFAWIKIHITAPTTLWLVDGAGPETLASALVEVEVADGVHASLRHLSMGVRAASVSSSCVRVLGPTPISSLPRSLPKGATTARAATSTSPANARACASARPSSLGAVKWRSFGRSSSTQRRAPRATCSTRAH